MRTPSAFSFQVQDRVGTITLNRPERLNALTFEVYRELCDFFWQLESEPSVAAVVITGAGRGFCSGGDVEAIIGQLLSRDTAALLDFTRMTGTVMQRMRECPIPIIAAVNGVAAGAGAVIALAADFRVLARSASFAFLFTKVGLSGADMGSAYLLPRLIGLGRATELLILGESISATRALEVGLAIKVVDDDKLATEAGGLARQLATGPALAHAMTKMLLARELDMNMAGALELDTVTQALLMKSADHAEFYAAFRQGRDPQWTGR